MSFRQERFCHYWPRTSKQNLRWQNFGRNFVWP